MTTAVLRVYSLILTPMLLSSRRCGYDFSRPLTLDATSYWLAAVKGYSCCPVRSSSTTIADRLLSCVPSGSVL